MTASGNPWADEANQIDTLKAQLFDSVGEVRNLRRQVVELKAAEARRLQELRDWQRASTLYTAFIELQQKRIETDLTDSNEELGLECRKDLWTYQHNLGYVLSFRSQRWWEASEESLRIAYQERARGLQHGERDADTQASLRQLCKVLRRMKSDDKQKEAERLYLNNWTVATPDLFALENGFELGTLYQGRGRYEKATIQLQDVWEQCKTRQVPFEFLLQTATSLTEVLLKLERTGDRLQVLEELWERRDDASSTWIVGNASMLSTLGEHYWAQNEWAKALPLWGAVWKVMNTCQKPGRHECKCASCGHSKSWFKSGLRYASSLRMARDPTNTANEVLEGLRTFISQAPKDSYPSAFDIDWEYAKSLSKPTDVDARSDVYQKRWDALTNENEVWKKHDRMLRFGFAAGCALEKAKKLSDSEKVLQQVFEARKALITQDRKETTEVALKIGEQLHIVLTTSRWITRAANLRRELIGLKRRIS